VGKYPERGNVSPDGSAHLLEKNLKKGTPASEGKKVAKEGGQFVHRPKRGLFAKEEKRRVL